MTEGSLPIDRALAVEGQPPSRCGEGGLERLLRSGRVATLLEARPPSGPDLDPLTRTADALAPYVDAFQLTDMPFATPHIANLAAGARLRERGLEVVLNVTCRDRNIIAQQGTLLGAAALGINNVFCIRGDRPTVGDHPHARGVFETSGLELIRLAKSLRSNGTYLSGRPFHPHPALFVGAAWAPHARYSDGPRALCQRKLDAGADFLVTQPLFDDEILPHFFAHAPELRTRCFVLGGLGPITNLETLASLQASNELMVPEELAAGLRAAPPHKRVDYGIDAALGTAQAALESGVHGLVVYPFDCGTEETRDFLQGIASLVQKRRSHDLQSSRRRSPHDE